MNLDLGEFGLGPEPPKCECGMGPGYTCHPDCPAFKAMPPAKITGKVTIDNTVVMTREQPALKASYTNQVFGTTDIIPLPLLSQDNNRKRAVVCSDALVILGKRSQLNTGASADNVTGFRLDAATGQLEITNQDELWVMPTGVLAHVSVMNERWN